MRTMLVCMLLVGCASESATDPNSVDLEGSYKLQPGEEKYFCYTTRMPADRDIAFTRLAPTYGNGTHHILVAQTFATEPEGFSECAVLFRDTWIPLYTGGLDSGPVAMPDGVGFTALEKGQQVLMQLHLQNATDEVIEAKTNIHIEFVDKTPELVPAGIFGMDNRDVNVPARTDSREMAMSCQPSHAMDVFAVMGHMHKHGLSFDVSRGATAGAEMLYQTQWSFETQPITPMTMHVNAGDNMHLRCRHGNSTDQPLVYGESSDNEMCSFVMYYAPAQSPLDGCINDT